MRCPHCNQIIDTLDYSKLSPLVRSYVRSPGPEISNSSVILCSNKDCGAILGFITYSGT
ncbi:MAG: hypothetical protein ACFFB5_11790 [Promethearchaeota archaeon]